MIKKPTRRIKAASIKTMPMREILKVLDGGKVLLRCGHEIKTGARKVAHCYICAMIARKEQSKGDRHD